MQTPGGDMYKTTYDTNANGKVNILDTGSISPEEIKKVPSDNLRHSIDALVNETGDSPYPYVKHKTLTFTNGIKGTIRIKFGMYTSYVDYVAYAILTHSGVAPGSGSDLGSEQTEVATGSQVKSQDIVVDIPSGGTINLWLHTSVSASGIAYAQDFKFYYDDDNGINVAVTGAD